MSVSLQISVWFTSFWVRGWVDGEIRLEKVESPGRCCQLSPALLPGRLSWTGPPPTERRALAFDSISSHRPSCLAARRAMSRFRFTTGFPALKPLSPFHADPVARALNHWCQSEPSSLSPVGVAPDLSAPYHCPVFRSCLRTRLPRSDPRSFGSPRTPDCQSRSPLPSLTRRCPRARSDPDADAVACSDADSPLPPITRRCS